MAKENSEMMEAIQAARQKMNKPDQQVVPSEKEEAHNGGEFDIASLLPSAGTIKLTKEEQEALYAPVNPEDIEIRPDGIIYLPWMEYVTRLKAAFGMEWALVPHGQPKLSNSLGAIYWGFWLIIKGCLYGYAIGEQRYFKDNKRMTYGDACEGAKSNALMRLCKGIGVSIEMWKPSFIRDWKKEYATETTGKGWHRKEDKEDRLKSLEPEEQIY